MGEVIKLAEKKPLHNYTQNAWEGEAYRAHQWTDIKDIAKMIRTYAKKKYPKCKFSVTIERYSGGQSMTIALTEAPFPALAPENAEVPDGWKNGYAQLNHYRLDPEEPRSNGAYLSREACATIKDVVDYAQGFNYSDCDGMIDYFHVNFYLQVNIGRWDKPFVQKEGLIEKEAEI